MDAPRVGRGTMTVRLGDQELDYTLWVTEIEPGGSLVWISFWCLRMAAMSYSSEMSVKPSEVNRSSPAAFEFRLTTQQSSLPGARLW